MRWDALFEDLEAQIEAADAAELDAEVRDRTRTELARVDLLGRLRASSGTELTLQLRSGERVRGTVVSLGSDWLLLEAGDADGPAGESLVPLRAVLVVNGLGPASVQPGGPGGVLAGRLDLRASLRGIARDRSPVRITTDDGAQLRGIVGRVGADHVEVPADPRDRSGPVVPFAALSLVQRLG
jgi:hypothetical protein